MEMDNIRILIEYEYGKFVRNSWSEFKTCMIPFVWDKVYSELNCFIGRKVGEEIEGKIYDNTGITDEEY